MTLIEDNVGANADANGNDEAVPTLTDTAKADATKPDGRFGAAPRQVACES